MTKFTKEQALRAKYDLDRAGECALVAYHTSEKWESKWWLKEADDAFKRAATSLGYLVEHISDGAAPDEQRTEEAREGGGSNPASDSPKPVLPFLRGI